MIPLGLGQAIIGGKLYNSYQSNIYFITCSQHNFKLTKMDQKLAVPRERFVAIPIPDTISGCMSEGKILFTVNSVIHYKYLQW